MSNRACVYTNGFVNGAVLGKLDASRAPQAALAQWAKPTTSFRYTVWRRASVIPVRTRFTCCCGVSVTVRLARWTTCTVFELRSLRCELLGAKRTVVAECSGCLKHRVCWGGIRPSTVRWKSAACCRPELSLATRYTRCSGVEIQINASCCTGVAFVYVARSAGQLQMQHIHHTDPE